MMSARKRSLVRFAGLALAVATLAVPASADVDVEFSGHLAGSIDRINAIDKSREEVFREFRKEGTRSQVKTYGQWGNTEWGNERVIPDIAAYNVSDLIRGMMDRGIKAADPDFAGKVVVVVGKLRIEDFSLATVSAPVTRMSGRVKVLDAAGNLVAEHEISTRIIPAYATSGYQGPDYAYLPRALNTRVGPIVAEFTEKALETLYPGYDAPGAVVISR